MPLLKEGGMVGSREDGAGKGGGGGGGNKNLGNSNTT